MYGVHTGGYRRESSRERMKSSSRKLKVGPSPRRGQNERNFERSAALKGSRAGGRGNPISREKR